MELSNCCINELLEELSRRINKVEKSKNYKTIKDLENRLDHYMTRCSDLERDCELNGYTIGSLRKHNDALENMFNDILKLMVNVKRKIDLVNPEEESVYKTMKCFHVIKELMDNTYNSIGHPHVLLKVREIESELNLTGEIL